MPDSSNEESNQQNYKLKWKSNEQHRIQEKDHRTTISNCTVTGRNRSLNEPITTVIKTVRIFQQASPEPDEF